MPISDSFVQDQWTPLSHKRAIGSGDWGSAFSGSRSWLGEHGRRLAAYRILQAYVDNASRHFLPTGDQSQRDNHREYGDAELLVEAIVGALLGDTQEIVVPAAADLPPTETDTTQRGELTPEEVQQIARAEKAAEREQWLRDWADSTKLKLRMLETESNAVGLGDGVYVLSLSGEKNRVLVSVYDPSFYFPILHDSGGEDFPTRVHLAWEVVQDDGEWRQVDPNVPNPPGVANSNTARRLRRITYELVKLPTPVRYPWMAPDEEPATTTCLMTDAVWTLGQDVKDIDSLQLESADFQTNEEGIEIRDLDLMVDFIPVVHIPNTASTRHHFGRSSLSRVAQILDDLQGGDTDQAVAADVVGAPPIAISGASSADDILSYGPGQVFNLGAEGKMDVLETSSSLDALSGHIDRLLKRLSVNSQVNEAVLGRIEGGVSSGIELALRFGPMQSMISKMRLVRHDKYPLLLKFVQRMAISGGLLEPGSVEDAYIAFGSFLPSDKGAAVNQVATLVNAKVISRLTGVQMLIEAGFPIEDATTEVERIEREDFEGAVRLLDALGNEAVVAEYLGRENAGGIRPPAPPITEPLTLAPTDTAPTTE